MTPDTYVKEEQSCCCVWSEGNLIRIDLVGSWKLCYILILVWLHRRVPMNVLLFMAEDFWVNHWNNCVMSICRYLFNHLHIRSGLWPRPPPSFFSIRFSTGSCVANCRVLPQEIPFPSALKSVFVGIYIRMYQYQTTLSVHIQCLRIKLNQ